MLTPALDDSPSSWITESLHGFAEDVGSVVPPVFDAYARIFHPATVGGVDERPVTWAEVAEANGRTVHSEMQFDALVPAGMIDTAGNLLGHQPGLWEGLPEEGSLDEDLVERLVPILRAHTHTPQKCWFAFWEGWGIPVESLARRKRLLFRLFERGRVTPLRPSGIEGDRWDAPKFEVPGRRLLLFTGSLDDARESFYEPYGSQEYQSACLWWPEDRSWCVSSEIDFMTTYVGGSEACVGAILEAPGLETLRAKLVDRITRDAINPNPHGQ